MWGAPDARLVADFEATDKLGKEALVEARKYDAVTCMFAIHYFFVSEDAITMFLRNVANNLKDGVSLQPVDFRACHRLPCVFVFVATMLLHRWGTFRLTAVLCHCS